MVVFNNGSFITFSDNLLVPDSFHIKWVCLFSIRVYKRLSFMVAGNTDVP